MPGRRVVWTKASKSAALAFSSRFYAILKASKEKVVKKINNKIIRV